MPAFVLRFSCQATYIYAQSGPVGRTTVSEWQYGKNGAVSITYDDASRNQFLKALPVMERIKNAGHIFCYYRPYYRFKIPG